MNSLINKINVVLLAFLLSAGSSFAQMSEQEKAVMAPINQLFEGMRSADTNLVAKVFAEKVNLMTAYHDKDGVSQVHHGSLEDFIKAIGNKPKDGPLWIEKIKNTEIRIDDNMAQVWTDYSFYLGDQFTHCGVNAFHLALLKGEWKIVQLIDTRRNKDCN